MSYTEFKDKEVKCRKPHVCDWCNEKIEIGYKAFYQVGIFYGGFYAGYQHLECRAAMIATESEYLEDGWSTGMFNRGQRAELFE